MNSLIVIALIVVGVIVALEIVFRVIFPKPPSWPRPQVRSKLDRTFGYVHRPKQECYSVDAKATINSAGFRGREPLSDRASGDLRVLSLGNSLTFGKGVADDETYPAQLEHQLREQYGPRVEVINAGIGAFTIRQYVAFVEHKLAELEPDLLVIGMQWLDLHHHARIGQKEGKVSTEAWAAIKKRFDETDAGLAAPKSRGEKLKDMLRHWRTFYVLYHGVQERRGLKHWAHRLNWAMRMLDGNVDEQISVRLDFSAEKLSYIAQLCEQNSANFLVAFFPDHRQIFRDYPNSVWPTALSDACDKAGIANVSLLPGLREALARGGKKIFVPYDITHYALDGNVAIARTITTKIQELGLLTRESSPVAKGQNAS